MAKLDDLIQQKQQRDEDWKAKKTAEQSPVGTVFSSEYELGADPGQVAIRPVYEPCH